MPRAQYQLTGWIVCRDCGRQFDAHWTHGLAGYRCSHGRIASTAHTGLRRNIYVREEQVLLFLAANIAELRHVGQADQEMEVITAYLADHEVVIRCGYYIWQLQLDGEPVADTWPPRLARGDNGCWRRRKTQDASQ